MKQLMMGLWIALVLLGGAARAGAQEVWVQIEARPTLREAEDRARAYASVFPNVRGYDIGKGWYGIVLGPYAPDAAAHQLDVLRQERMIPSDSFIADGSAFKGAFWPVSGALTPTPDAATPDATSPDATSPAPAVPEDPEPAGTTLPAPATPAAPEAAVTEPAATQPLPDETPKQARAAEAALGQDGRILLQTALQWNGVYGGALDGAIGAGTRKSMAAWQAAKGYDETGILTTRQRDELTGAYRAEVDALGLTAVHEQEAGIDITLPAKLVAFDHYEPPFVQYGEKDGSGYQVLLISQQGDENTLFGLYDIMQTLKIVPLDGERERKQSAFLLTGKNADLESYTQAELRGGLIRGFTLVWKPADGARAAKVLAVMKSTFKPFGDRALDEGLGQPSATTQGDLTSGLEVRKPKVSRSGFYVDAAGAVVTSADVLDTCARLTLDGQQEAVVAGQDPATGLAILKPATPLAPAAYARFQSGAPRKGADVAVAGYSYETALDAPVVTFGTLAAPTGLDGETDRYHLTISARAGDSGGPVLDTAGGVIGMLLPRLDTDGRVLPADAAFALTAPAISAALAAAGLTPAANTATGSLAAEDLSRIGRAMTVLVSCWE